MYLKILKYIFTVLAVIWLVIASFIALFMMVPSLFLLLFSKKLFGNWVLFSTAKLLAVGLYPLGFLYRLLKWKGFASYLLKCATTIDISANVYADELFNDNWIKPTSGQRFGNIRETISDNLGENERDKTLTVFGQRFSNLLSVFDFNHAIKSIRNE